MSLQSRYTILRKIADGGTAEIFLAKQHGAQGFEKMVVLKRIFTTFYADPQFRHMLVDEAHIAMSLNHSNIVQVLDLGEADGRYFLALELVDGWTLDKILRRSKSAGVPFPPALALYVTAEVCRALGYAHAKGREGKALGIVHRDISPHNVLLSAEGEVKLTDFGIAKAHNKKEQSLGNMIKGKISFMSPEQASGAEIDARSDLFSLGTMLYVMITRRFPFDAPTDYETLMLVKSGDYLPPETARPGLNPELYRVIRKAMGKTPADRYQKAEEMLVDVEQVMRLAFRPVGQTELQRWLADLTTKDGVPPLTREAPPEPATVSTVGPLAEQAAARKPRDLRKDESQESGLVLDMADAVEVAPGAGPPPPPRATAPPVAGPTQVMREPEASSDWAAPWYKRRAARIGGGVVLVLLLGLSAKALVRSGRREAPATPGPTAAAAPTPTAPAAPAVAAAAGPPAAPVPPPAPPRAAADSAAAEPPAVAGAPEPAPAAERTPPAAVVAAVEPEKQDDQKDQKKDEAPAGDAPAEDQGAAARAASKGAAASAPMPVSVKSDPEGSRVSTGHHTFGVTPLAIKMRPGNSYALTFTKPGYAPLTKKVVVTPKVAQGIRVTLKKLPEPAAKPTASTPAHPAQPAGQPAQQHAKKEWWKLQFGR